MKCTSGCPKYPDMVKWARWIQARKLANEEREQVFDYMKEHNEWWTGRRGVP